MRISEANGDGRQRGHTQIYRGAEYAGDLLPKVRLEILGNAESDDQILDLLISTANNLSAGDGKIWGTHVWEVIRARTRERGKAAV